MPLKYFYNKYKHPEETVQFSELLPKLTSYFSEKSETAYFIGCGEMGVNGRSIDALLITPQAFVGIEFKNYANDNDIVTVIDNDSPGSWLVFNPDGTPKKDENGEQLFVKGGQFANPYSQAHNNRQKLIETLKNSGLGSSILTNRNLYGSRIPYFAVFTKDLDLESKRTLAPNTKSWFKVTTNNKFIEELDSKLKSYKRPAFIDKEIQIHFLERWGFHDLHDPSEWSKQKHTEELGKHNRKNSGDRTPYPPETTSQKVSSVLFSYDGRILSMSSKTHQANIYYTLDGRIPSVGTTRYMSPFRIRQAKTVKAIAVKKGLKNSDITSFTIPPGNPVMEFIRKYWLWIMGLAVVIAIAFPFAKRHSNHQTHQTSELREEVAVSPVEHYPRLDGKGWIVKRMDGQAVTTGLVNAEIFSPSEQQHSVECRMAIIGDYESQHREITFSYDRQSGRLISPQLGEGSVEIVNRMIQLRITFEGWIIER